MRLFIQLILLAAAAFFLLLSFIATVMSKREDAQKWAIDAIAYGVFASAVGLL